MRSDLLRSEMDVQHIRELLARLGMGSTVVDFEQNIAPACVRESTRLWRHGDHLLAFVRVDPCHNLVFKTGPACHLGQVEGELVRWGVGSIQESNAAAGRNDSLNAWCQAGNRQRIAMLMRHGFVCQQVRTLRCARPLSELIAQYPLPPGFTLRCVEGEHEFEFASESLWHSREVQ